jgi:hypothetical protein
MKCSSSKSVPLLPSTQTPLTILGFHSDNSSEFINHVVARWLNKLRG